MCIKMYISQLSYFFILRLLIDNKKLKVVVYWLSVIKYAEIFGNTLPNPSSNFDFSAISIAGLEII